MGLHNTTSYLCIFLRMYHSSFHTGIFCESNMFCSVTFYSAWCYYHYYCVIPFFLIMETPTDFLLKKEEEIHNPHRWWRVKNCRSKYRVTQIYSLQSSQGVLIYVTIIHFFISILNVPALFTRKEKNSYIVLYSVAETYGYLQMLMTWTLMPSLFIVKAFLASFLTAGWEERKGREKLSAFFPVVK